MEGVEFEDEYNGSEFHIRSRRVLGEKTTPGMISFLMERGVAKNEKSAVILLGIGIAIFVGLSIMIIRSTLVTDTKLVVFDKYNRPILFEEYIEALERGEDLLQ